MKSFRVPTVVALLAVLGVVWTAPAVAKDQNMCISANGTDIIQLGTATCTSAGKGSLAMAFGDNAEAIARGANAFVDTAAGKKNRAFAFGDGCIAQAAEGDRNRAKALADNATANAFGGNNNTAIAKADGCIAQAIGDGQTDICPPPNI